MENVNDKIILNEEELLLFETFLQYGNLKNASLVFIGIEEGLGEGDITLAIKSRQELHNNDSLKKHIVYINEKNIIDGWYLTEASFLRDAQNIIQGIPIGNRQDLKTRQKQTMSGQARIHWLMQGDNRSLNYSTITKQDFPSYDVLHNETSKSSMIDYFPLPKYNENEYPFALEGIYRTKKSYYKHYNTLDSVINNRFRILKNVYNKYPMNVSIVYAGIKNFRFKLKPFYESLGFDFAVKYTNVLNPAYLGPIIVPTKGQVFLLGHRTVNGYTQIAILTPFLGQGRISNAEIDVISTWIPA
jgi:hypothetical protein